MSWGQDPALDLDGEYGDGEDEREPNDPAELEEGYPHGAAPSGYGPALVRSGATAYSPWEVVGTVSIPASAALVVADDDGTPVDVIAGQERELHSNGAVVRYRLTGYTSAGVVRDVWVHDLAATVDAQRAAAQPSADRVVVVHPASRWHAVGTKAPSEAALAVADAAGEAEHHAGKAESALSRAEHYLYGDGSGTLDGATTGVGYAGKAQALAALAVAAELRALRLQLRERQE